MKARIRIKEKGREDIVKEVVIPDKAHLEAQLKYRHTVVESKKRKLQRKEKHKIDYRRETDGSQS